MSDEQQAPKRYLVFAGDAYYPCGGWDDFVGRTDSLEDARAMRLRTNFRGQVAEHDWWQIVDTHTWTEIT